MSDDAHAGGIVPRHPRREMGPSAVRLHDDQVGLAAIAVDADHVDSFAAARMERITNDHVVGMIVGSVLPVRLGPARVI